MVVRLQPSWRKEFTFFWQKKKDEILKAWLIYICIYGSKNIYIFSFLRRALVLPRGTGATQSRRDGSHPGRAGSGAEVREEEEACLGWADLRVNADTSILP